MRVPFPRAAALAISGCAACVHPSLVCPQRGGAAWTEFTSAHYVVSTDLPPEDARAALDEFERTYGAFLDLAFSFREPPHGRVALILFRREQDFRDLTWGAGRNLAAFFDRTDVDGAPTVVLFGDFTRATRRVFQHELAHRFVNHHIAQAPLWLNEGLAEYYSTLLLTGTDAIIGETPPDRTFTDEPRTAAERTPEGVRVRVAVPELPPVAELLRVDRLWLARNPERISQFYAAAWALVHLYANGPPERAAHFDAFLRALAAGQRYEEAWSSAFAGTDLDALDRELRTYLLRGYVPERQMHYKARPALPPERERAMADDEVHVLWARLRPWSGEDNLRKAGEDLAAAEEQAPASAEARYWMARYLRRRAHFGEAETELRRALALSPREPRYWHALAEMLYALETSLPGAYRNMAGVEEALQKLAASGPSAWGLNMISWYYAQVGLPDEGLRFARRAVDAEPGCWQCLDTLALLLFEKGRPEEALEMQRRALNLLPESFTPDELSARLYHYERAAQDAAPAAKGTTGAER